MKKYKGYIIGGLVGASLMFSAQSFAAIGEKAEAIFSQFNFVINGQAKTLDESPVVINGNSYLPVRSISNALGYDVTYKADSRTIELNNGVGSASSQTKPQAQPAAPQANVTNSPVEDNYAGKVFVSNADLFPKLLKETDKILEINDQDSARIVIFNKKEVVLNPFDYYYDINTRSLLLNVSHLEKIIPTDILSTLPKYQISNGVVTKK
ncbi:copper amine oxidase N-terminal domain-containing protein [Paenibacillus sp. FSL H8-0034]|uniref:copper amine oxidase N-terminal domain-containing protein n=1 Tax=Paenibacillus sp. FSL H8-0034 TaxID=2954671 RepID=UPI0030FCC776